MSIQVLQLHTKIIIKNLNDVVGDVTQFQSLEMEGNVTSSLGKSKFTDKLYFDGNGDLSQNIQAQMMLIL